MITTSGCSDSKRAIAAFNAGACALRATSVTVVTSRPVAVALRTNEPTSGLEYTLELFVGRILGRLVFAGGACGIGYFTSSWTSGRWNRWDFEPRVEQALPAIVARVQRLAPALCAEYGSVVVPWDGSVAASLRTLNGALYLIAVNSAAQPTTIPFRVDALAGRELVVLDENRVIHPAKKVYFRDHFGPYEVHVYLAAPTG